MTLFDSIYDKFLSIEIDDSELALLSDAHLKDLCFKYLEKARSLYFPECEKDLSDVEVEVMADDDGVEYRTGKFNQELTVAEQYILSLGMKKAWLSSKRFSQDLMSKDIGDRDYKAIQGYDYQKEARMNDIALEREIRIYAISGTYTLGDVSNGW